MRLLTQCLLLSLAVPSVVSAQVIVNHSTSKWSDPVATPHVPVAAANLPDGRVMTWSAARKDHFRGDGGKTNTSIFDPSSMTTTDTLVIDTQHDMFCPGTAQLADGRIMISGGRTASAVTFYDPARNTWTKGEKMNIPRGYPANTPLSDGSVFTLGGSWGDVRRGGKLGELWTERDGWRVLPGIATTQMETDDPEGVYRSDNQMWLFEAPNGRVFHAGPSRRMHWIDLKGNGSVTFAGTRGNDKDAMNGNAVLYDIGKILTVGGSTSYSSHTAASRNAFTIDINNRVSVRSAGNMRHARTYVNSVVLPSGEVLVTGGMATAQTFSDTGAALPAEIWNPKTRKWKTLASMNVPRTYHSVSILLKDGRVMTGGGGLCGGCPTNHYDVEVFTPPYLLNANGSPARRPVITEFPDTSAAIGSQIHLSMRDSAHHDFALVRTSAVTHSTNNDQRRIPLRIVRRDGNNFILEIPQNASIAQPGNYFLFAINRSGVPSVGEHMRVQINANGNVVALRSFHSDYMRATREGNVIAAPKQEVEELFTIAQSGNEIALRSSAGLFLSAHRDTGAVAADRARIRGWELFTPVRNIDQTTSFKSVHNRYLSAKIDGSYDANVTANRAWEGFDMIRMDQDFTMVDYHGNYVDTWRGELRATNTRTFNRSVFKLVDGHDGTVSILTSEGTYVSALPNGDLSFNNTVVGSNERFTLVRNDDATYSFRSNRGRYISSKPDTFPRADVTRLAQWEKFRITFE